MNLIFRMLYVFVLSKFREPLGTGRSVSRLSLRVLPNDLDINLHMNNGRYLTICDLNRVDLFIRTGLLKAMFRRRWIPVIAEHTMTYKKPLGLFDRYDVLLEVTHSDEKYFYMTHTFIKDECIMAEGTSKGCVYARGVGVISPAVARDAVEEDQAN
ncbi:MAG: thioesterase family protein [Gallionella sp.]|nr:thioesterase family protein [Gallionella sp.]